MKIKRFFCSFPLAGLLLLAPLRAADYDVVVVGATPAGVAAAVNAAREGARVALFEETGHIGGLASGGLSNTDFRTFPALGGTFREFMSRVEAHYARAHGPDSRQVKDSMLGGYYEPSVARRVFEEMLAEQPNLRLFKHHRLTGAETVQGAGGSVRLQEAGFTDLGGGRALRVRAAVFIDATYEGDLLAAAGAAYRLGCESVHEYNEDLAFFDEPNAYVQTYNFRICLSHDPENSIEFPRPGSYNREEFLPLLEYMREGRIKVFSNEPHANHPNALFKVRHIPNLKADFNDDAKSPFSLSLKNINHPWPEGGPEVRAQIFQRYKDYSLGLFWFLANDPEVPEHFRTEMRKWGLPKDEFADTGHWTPALYVREGRRMIGEYIYTQHDTQPAPDSVRAPLHRDSVAIGDYSLNCHGVFSPAPGVNIGHFGRQIRPYQIPYGVIVPKDLDGLLVPVAVSASHVGYSALRMEPSWTALGQAAGLAAAMAAKQEIQPRAVNVPRLQERLHALGAMTVYVADLGPEVTMPRPSWDPPGERSFRHLGWPPASPYFRAVQFLGTRGFFHHLGDSEQYRRLGLPPLTGQWRQTFPEHGVGLDLPLDAELRQRWLDQAKAEFGRPVQVNVAAGMTRGEFLQQLYEAVTGSF